MLFDMFRRSCCCCCCCLLLLFEDVDVDVEVDVVVVALFCDFTDCGDDGCDDEEPIRTGDDGAFDDDFAGEDG